MQPEVPFSTTTVQIWSDSVKNWRSYERRNQKTKRIFIYIAIDPKGQGDRQAHIIFYTPQGYMYYPDLSNQFVTQSNA